MGFGTVAASIILFIAILTVASGFVILMNTYAQETSTSMTMQHERLSQELRTDITISDLNYSEGEITLYVINTGKTDLMLDRTDVYVSGERIERTSRTITLEQDTKITEPPIWSPNEIVKIVVTKTLDQGLSRIRVVTSTGRYDEKLLSL